MLIPVINEGHINLDRLSTSELFSFPKFKIIFENIVVLDSMSESVPISPTKNGLSITVAKIDPIPNPNSFI